MWSEEVIIGEFSVLNGYNFFSELIDLCAKSVEEIFAIVYVASTKFYDSNFISCRVEIMLQADRNIHTYKHHTEALHIFIHRIAIMRFFFASNIAKQKKATPFKIFSDGRINWNS